MNLAKIVGMSDADYAWHCISEKRQFKKQNEMTLDEALAEFATPINPQPIRKRKLELDDEAFDAYAVTDSGCLPEVRR